MFSVGTGNVSDFKIRNLKIPIGYAQDGIVKVPDIGSDLKHQFYVKYYYGKV